MKHRYFFSDTFPFAAAFILVSFLCVFSDNSFAQDWKTIHDGVEYAHVDHKIGSDPVKINLLRLDLKKVRLDVHHAFDRAVGVETTSAIAARHNAVAAINAGFFRLDKSEFAGDAAGLLMIDGRLISESVNDRVSVGIGNYRKRTEIFFGHFTSQAFLSFSNADEYIQIDGFNRERKPGEVVIYGNDFGGAKRAVVATSEFVLSKCKQTKDYELRTVSCRSYRLTKDARNNAIPPRGFIVSLSVEATDQLEKIMKASRAAGQRVNLRFRLKEQSGAGIDILLSGSETDITNGVPQLIKDSRIDVTWEKEKASKSFAEMRHPRTAVAKLKDGKFLMITVDGRQPGVSVGMNLQELAEYILSLGATDAMNLDGGGSTTMYVDGKVLNTPSDKEGERKVSDAILVTLRKNKRR